MTRTRCAYLCWGTALLVALGIQTGLWWAIADGVGIWWYYGPMYALILLTTIASCYFFCKSRKVSSNQGEDDDEEEAKHHPGTIEEGQSVPPSTTTESPSFAPRLHFLDNVKVFLTYIVLTHHVTCAFGGCGPLSFPLSIGEYPTYMTYGTKSFVLLNQAYFMPLFFFVSAFFTPGSYDRKGGLKFILDKAKRLWIPAMVATFTLVPFSDFIAQATASMPLSYRPGAGHCWFLFWLFVFDWVYYSVRAASSSAAETAPSTSTTGSSREDNEPRPVPRIIVRLLYGVLICGLLMYAFFRLVGGLFWSMPGALGSLPCDIVLFVAGVLAARNGWLLPSIRSKLDLPVWILHLSVVAEAAAMVGTALFAVPNNENWFILVTVVAGVYCLDMSLAILDFFQQYADACSQFSRFLSEAAYTVYIIHPFVIVGATAVFVNVYNGIYDDLIQFPYGPFSTSALAGPGAGSLHLFVGWLIVLIVSNLICWPLGWWIRRLPGLNQVL